MPDARPSHPGPVRSSTQVRAWVGAPFTPKTVAPSLDCAPNDTCQCRLLPAVVVVPLPLRIVNGRAARVPVAVLSRHAAGTSAPP
jgi:hypothetical protein